MISYKKFTSERLLIKMLRPRVCRFCPTTDENNFEPDDGKLYPLQLFYVDKNQRNQKLNNIGLICRIHIKRYRGRLLIARALNFKDFVGTGRL